MDTIIAALEAGTAEVKMLGLNQWINLARGLKSGKYSTTTPIYSMVARIQVLCVDAGLIDDHRFVLAVQKRDWKRAKFWAYKNYLAIAFGFKQVVENFHWWQLCLSHETRPEFLMDRFWDRLNTYSAIASVKWD